MEFFKKYRWILVLIACSLIVRMFVYFYIMNSTPFPDYFAYKEWIYKSYSVGLNRVYMVHSPHNIMDVNQPPGTIYILRGAFELFLLTARIVTHFLHVQPNKTLWINDNLLIFFFRLPSLVADLLLGYLIYITVKSQSNEKLALVSSALYLFGPPIIYNSTVWGQMDSINNLLFCLSIFFLLKKRAFPSVFCYALSLFIKLSLASLIPVYLLFAVFGGYFQKSTFIKSVIITTIIIWILCIPFSPNPLWIIEIVKKSSMGISQDISSNAFNVWWLIFNPAVNTSPPSVTTLYYGFSLNTLAAVLFSVIYLPILFYSVRVIRRKKLNKKSVYFILGLAAFASFLFLPKMHERYLYPAFPLLITWVGMKNKHWISVTMLSIIHFLNLYIVWNPNLFLFGNFENVLKSQNSKWFLSLATLLIFGYYYIQIRNNKGGENYEI